MENQNKSIVSVHSSCAVLNLNIILAFYLPLFCLFLSHPLIINFPVSSILCIFFPIQKKLSFSLTQFFFPFYVGFIIIIFLAFLS